MLLPQGGQNQHSPGEDTRIDQKQNQEHTCYEQPFIGRGCLFQPYMHIHELFLVRPPFREELILRRAQVVALE